ncbi:MAG: hypothetical protein WDN28_10730 [Chthoniobacter sp.]
MGGLAAASVTRTIVWRGVGWVCALLFGAMLYLSGGRSAFFGVAAAAIAAVAFQVVPVQMRRWTNGAILGWLVFALFVSFYGVGELTEHISDLFFPASARG